MVVIAIIIALVALTNQALQSARASAKRLQCISNIRSLGVAAIIYADSAHGNFPAALDEAKCFGLLYDPLSFNDMTVFVCKSKNSSELPPNVSLVSTQYEITGNISYCFVKKQEIDPTKNMQTKNMQTMSDPSTNIFLIEKFTGEGFFAATDNHDEFGGSCFRINGKAEFIGKDGEAFPPNQNKAGVDYSINKDMTTMN